MGVQSNGAPETRDPDGIAKLQWTLKGVDSQTRDLTRQAARKSGMLLGTWVEQALRSAAEDQLNRRKQSDAASNQKIVELLEKQTQTLEEQKETIRALQHELHVIQMGMLEKLVAR